MKAFNILGYRITIRKIKAREPHPMDCRAYHARLDDAKKRRTENLRREVNKKKD